MGKQNASIAGSPTRSVSGQSNRLSLFLLSKLIYMTALKVALRESL
jgi:hypothetical protein